MDRTDVCVLNSACVFELKKFLSTADSDFPIPLSRKTDLGNLAHKLLKNGLAMVIINGSDIASGCFGYANDVESKVAYISVVATLKDFRGMGLAEKCIRVFLDEAKKLNMESVVLYTHNTNQGAVKLYEKIGFIKIPSDRYGDIKMTFDLR